jgi:hypothetical protein
MFPNNQKTLQTVLNLIKEASNNFQKNIANGTQFNKKDSYKDIVLLANNEQYLINFYVHIPF